MNRTGRTTRPGPMLTYGNVVSTIALFAVLSGGVAYGAAKIGAKNIKRDAVRSKHLRDGAVGTADLAAQAVGAAQLRPGSVGSAQLAGGAVGTAKIAGRAVTGQQIANGAVSTNQIANGAVQFDQIADGAVGPGKTSPAFALAGLQNGWQTPSGQRNPGVYRGGFGMIHLEGAATQPSGAGGTLFTLDPEFRPPNLITVPTICVALVAVVPAALIIGSNGAVTVSATGDSEVPCRNGGFTSLEGVSFHRG